MLQWTVGRYMTKVPESVSPRQKLIEAHRLMREHRIRHLPVLDGGKLVGVVTMGDLHLLETLRDVDPEEDVVEFAMTPAPYTVGPDAPLREVTRVMAEQKYGSAIVVERGKVRGIFTTNDALRALVELLASRVRRTGSRAAAKVRAAASPSAKPKGRSSRGVPGLAAKGRSLDR